MKIKKIISSLFLASMALFSFNACSDVPNPYDIPEIGDSSIYGTGTMQNPYVVKGAALNQNGKLAWVKAYITGYIPSGGDAGSTISDAVFGTEGAGESNIVVSATPDNKNINNCLAVQLPIGEIRDSLNLSSHPQNLYQEVMLLGTMVNYFGGPGVKDVQAYIMNGDTIGNIPAEEVKAIFSETFATGQGDFIIDNIEVPNEMPEVWTWKSSYKCMVATSFKTDGYINYPAESWLISPEIDLTKAENATLTFERVLYKVNNITIWAKESGSANWNELDMPNKEVTTSWTFQKSGDIDLNSYKGKKIQIGFKYLATDQAGTFELKNFTIEDRVAGETPENPTENESSKENPFSVATAISKYNASNPQANTWVKGYIVGYVNGMTIDGAILNDLSSITDDNKTNLLISDSKTETDYKNCLVLQLPSGDIRNALNLKDNPSNLNKELIVKGSLEKYFGTYGLKFISEYVLDGQSSGGTEEPDGDAILEESFNNTFGSFTTQNVLGAQEWKPNSYGYVSMSAYSNGSSAANEDWLISPVIDLSKERTLTFEHAMGKAGLDLSNAPEQYTVWVSTDYNGDVNTATWTQVNITYPAASGWTFETVTTKLPAVGAKAYFAFKYKNAENANTITWEIKNLSVK